MLGFAPVIVVKSHGRRCKKLIERLLHGEKLTRNATRSQSWQKKKARSIIRQKKQINMTISVLFQPKDLTWSSPAVVVAEEVLEMRLQLNCWAVTGN